MSSAAKKQDDLPLEALELPSDLPSDREQKLSKSFEDPALEDLIPGLGASDTGAEVALSVTEEAAAAVHELVQEAAGEHAIDLSADFGEALPLPESPPAEAAPAPAAARAVPPPSLPQTVNPNPDPLERSLLIAAPPQPEHDDLSASLAFEGHSAEARSESALYRMSEVLFELVACERTFDEVVERGLRAIMDGVDAHAGSVLELDHEHEDFFFRASFGGAASHTQLRSFRVPLTKGIVGHVAESGQTLLIRNLADDERQMRAISVSVGFAAVTCIAAPILVGGQPYGVIEVFNKRDGSLFEEKDVRVLEEGVRMLAKVLEVRFLMAELSRRVGKR